MTGLPASLILVGAGKMGGALLERWFASGLQGSVATIFDPAPSDALARLCRDHGAELNPPRANVAPPAALVLAIKPQMLDEAAPDLAALVGPQTLVLSIMAGKTIADLAARLPARAIVRAMPNTPAAVGRGMTGAVASGAVAGEQRAAAQALLAAVGAVEWLDDEGLMDAVTALSGSGPAYVFYLVECLAAAGVDAGLSPDVAARLARATVEGAGELLYRDTAIPADQLLRNVTSPGGTTAAALEALMAPAGLAPLMSKAVAAAKRRAAELSG